MHVCMYVYSSYHLIVGVFARKVHSTTKFAMTVLSKGVKRLNRRKTSPLLHSLYFMYIIYIYMYIYMYIYTSNLLGCDGIQFPTDHSNDPFLV